MKEYRVTLIYKIYADSETDAQIQALQSSVLNLTQMDCEEMQRQEEQEVSLGEIPF